MGSNVIVLLVGLPGAGKTTFSKCLKDYLKDYEVTVFHYDFLCKMFTANERKHVLEKVQEFILNSVKLNVLNVIIIDDNNYYKSMQSEYLRLCKKCNLGFIIVYLKISLDNALLQNLLRDINHQVPNAVITNMFLKLEEPTGEHVICIDVNQSDRSKQYDFEFIKNRILHASSNCLIQQTKQCSIIQIPQSYQQKVDIALRRLVHRHCLENKSRAHELNILKRQLYSKICTKQIVLSVCHNHSFEDIDVQILEEELKKYFV